MHEFRFLAVTAGVLLVCAPAYADTDPVLAGVVGAATVFTGFAIGGTLMGVTGDNSAANMAGWLTMESGFALAPFTAHAVVGEWWRGVAFSALPTATTLGTVPVFLYNEECAKSGRAQIPLIVPANEQGAGFMAAGYARASGRVGVCLVTSGPGATNTVTPVRDCMADSIPIVVICGQVPRASIGTDAFQEAPVPAVISPPIMHRPNPLAR